jgi:hypothetical protein
MKAVKGKEAGAALSQNAERMNQVARNLIGRDAFAVVTRKGLDNVPITSVRMLEVPFGLNAKQTEKYYKETFRVLDRIKADDMPFVNIKAVSGKSELFKLTADEEKVFKALNEELTEHNKKVLAHKNK